MGVIMDDLFRMAFEFKGWFGITIALIALICSGFRVAQEYERSVIFRLGRYKSLKGPGLYWIIPFI